MIAFRQRVHAWPELLMENWSCRKKAWQIFEQWISLVAKRYKISVLWNRIIIFFANDKWWKTRNRYRSDLMRQKSTLDSLPCNTHHCPNMSLLAPQPLGETKVDVKDRHVSPNCSIGFMCFLNFGAPFKRLFWFNMALKP